MRVLVIGSGFLGWNMLNVLKKSHIISVGTYYNKKKYLTLKLDITNIKSVEKSFSKFRPDIVINCAANTDLDYLEKNPREAYLVNSDGVRNITMIAEKYGSKIIHISTDGVFDGKKGMYSEYDKPNPINVYGKSKLLGELQVKEYSTNYVIIRTNFYGINNQGKFLFNWILANLRKGSTFTGFEDVLFTPLEISNLCETIKDIAKTDFVGILNVASSESINKYEFAKTVACKLGYDKNLVKRGSINNFEFHALRPKNTSLMNSLLKNTIEFQEISLCQWLDSIRDKIR